MPDASRSLKQPFRALRGAGRRETGRRARRCMPNWLPDAAAAARGATDCDGKDLLHTTNDDGATKG